jgi:hypothetical protein
MDAIPVPEIVVSLVICAILLIAKALWGIKFPVPFAPLLSDFRRSRPEDTNTDHVRARLIASCVVFAMISIPLILRLVPPNGIYGFRTGATQSSRAIWYPANAFMGWALLAAAAIGATLQVVLPPTVKRWFLWAAFVIPVIGAIVTSLAYVSRLN